MSGATGWKPADYEKGVPEGGYGLDDTLLRLRQKAQPAPASVPAATTPTPESVTANTTSASAGPTTTSETPTPYTPAGGGATPDRGGSIVDGLQGMSQRARDALRPYQEKNAELAASMPDPTKIRPPSGPMVLPPAPSLAVADPVKAFGSFASVLATFASFLTRRPLITALNASAGAMNAIRQNDMTTYEAKKKEWQEATQAAFKQADYEQKVYKDILDQTHLSIDEKNAQIRANAAAMKDEMTLMHLDSGVQEQLLNHLDRRDALTQRTQAAAATLQQRAEHQAYLKDQQDKNPYHQAYQALVDEYVKRTGHMPDANERIQMIQESNAAQGGRDVMNASMTRSLDRTMSIIDEAEKSGEYLTGFGNKLTAFGDWARQSHSTLATRFQSQIRQAQDDYMEFKKVHRMSAASAVHMDQIIPGLNSFSTLEEAKAAIQSFKDQMADTIAAEHQFRDQSPSGPGGQHAALFTPENKKMLEGAFASIKDQKAQEYIANAISKLNMDPVEAAAFISVGHNESGWNLNERTGDGGLARGATQIHPDTAREHGGFTEADLANPETNVLAGATYFHDMYLQSGKDVNKAAALYHQGQNSSGTDPKYAGPVGDRMRQWDGQNPSSSPSPGDGWTQMQGKDGRVSWYKPAGPGKWQMLPLGWNADQRASK